MAYSGRVGDGGFQTASRRGDIMYNISDNLLNRYIENIKSIYGSHLRRIILYGSYARGDFNKESDIDIMILLDLSDIALKEYGKKLSYMTFDFNMDNNVYISPFAKNEEHFNKWAEVYPFYLNVKNEGVILYEAV